MKIFALSLLLSLLVMNRNPYVKYAKLNRNSSVIIFEEKRDEIY